MFKKILIANRGEIAIRINNTCREMGIETIAIYSDSDEKALHVIEADQAVYLGGSEPVESYLNINKIITAVKKTGADAVHPGYGFLSENPDFAERCRKEGIVFIGPPPEVIRNLGDKITARQIMTKANVSIVPGMIQTDPNPDVISLEAEKIGYPIIIKAAAGGGGKGMRIVYAPNEMKDACISASREAMNAFGNGTIYVEKYIPRSRHIEFQILADSYGNVIHLFERECSIQRRHQKIIEETPSPIMTQELREKMGQAAVTAAKAAGYINAGTIEFIVDENNNFYFLEVNTRLQVEHPITEMITGIDLVRQQIEIAAGSRLSLSQKDITRRGHAIECRIYAEDPENEFIPSPGKIFFLKEPKGPCIRNDSGVYSGCNIPVEYDPILSKLIVHAENRELAISRMVKALKEYVILGVKTPIPFLIDVFRSKSFSEGETFTDFIKKNFPDWSIDMSNADNAKFAYIVDEISGKKKNKSILTGESEDLSPWNTLGNWRQY